MRVTPTEQPFVVDLLKLFKTVLTEVEYRELLQWRQAFLDPNREGDPPPLDPQLACYAIADVMRYRQIHDLLDFQRTVTRRSKRCRR